MSFDRDKTYWNKFYDSGSVSSVPSPFAQFVSKRISGTGKKLLELGCGNGRDSVYFMQHGAIVTAVDASDKAIELLEKAYGGRGSHFVCGDFVSIASAFEGMFDYCYSRFSLHAIDGAQEAAAIANIRQALKDGGELFIETRGVNDSLFGKGESVGRNSFVYDGHFRRFIVKAELEDSLKKAGYVVSYSKESTGFAPYKGIDDPVIRIVAVKHLVDRTGGG